MPGCRKVATVMRVQFHQLTFMKFAFCKKLRVNSSATERCGILLTY